ncbi:Asp23/Gls24 family envelope stress response protein [Chloroflexota bacterium]
MDDKLGRIAIAPNVLVTIVQKTAAAVAGVAELSDAVPGVKRLLGLRTVGRGTQVDVVDDQVYVDVFVVARRDVALLQMGREIQHEVARDIEHIVGMDVCEVNVHIEDIEFETSQPDGVEKGQATR